MDILHDGAIEIADEARVLQCGLTTTLASIEFASIKGGGVDGDYPDFKNRRGHCLGRKCHRLGLDVRFKLT